jgi:hypothetical protein
MVSGTKGHRSLIPGGNTMVSGTVGFRCWVHVYYPHREVHSVVHHVCKSICNNLKCCTV